MPFSRDVRAASSARPGARVLGVLGMLCVSALVAPGAFAGKHEKQAERQPAAIPKGAVAQAGNFTVGKPVAFGITPAIRDLPPAPPVSPNAKDGDEPSENRRVKRLLPGAGAGEGPFTDVLALLGPRVDAPMAMPSPLLTFIGLTGAEACDCSPPDTNGDVGPNHYVQSVNVRVSIYDKSGTRLLGPSLQSAAFFTGLPAGNVCRTSDDGDPVILYDSLADRWLISQFEVDDVPGHQCIAISTTPDPTGAYYAYDFVMPNTKFFDYPHYGVWPNGYYLTVNQFNQAGTAFQGAGIFAFDRIKMLAGDPTAGYVYHDVAADDANAGGMLPTDFDGIIPPPAGLPNRVMEFRADEFGDPADTIRTYELVPNYATPAASTFTIRSDVPLAAFDARSPANTRNVVEQPGGGPGLDAINDRLMFRLAYRNFGTPAAPVNSWVGNFTVNVSGVNPTAASTYQAGVRWFELRSSDSSSLPTVRDQGTQNTAPANGAAGVNNFMGSIAQDNQGNIGLGFTASSTTQNPNIVIAGRTGAATGAGMNEGEALFFASGGVQTSSGNRWGDYSSMSIDPVDECTFWYSQEYYAATSSIGWSTRIGSFKFPACTAPQRGSITASITDCVSNAPVAGASVTVTGGFFRSTNAAGNLGSSISVAPGTYAASASKIGYSTETNPALVVSNGGTANFSACLVPQPVINATVPVTIVSESYSPPNNALDPGEQVTLSYCVNNSGPGNSTNLVGTLAAGGGVTNPGAAQTYGVVSSGGAAVCRNFSFTVDPALVCGDTVTASIAFVDGAVNFGTRTYPVVSGASAGVVTQTVSYTGPAVSVPDNVPAGVNIPVTVSGIAGTITDLNFRFDAAAGQTCDATVANANAAMDHTYIGDLSFTLTSPAATTLSLVARRGGTRENICTAVLDDEGGFPALSTLTSVSGQTMAGNFTPEASLGGFDGQAANGNWVLNVSDNANIDVGSMRRYSLIISSENRVCADGNTVFRNGFE